ncbi:MAG: SAM-dependent methyltransferase [Spirochaetales bacterium]|nr:SAM-dependent methyltransferase [Spirochaetales bacterium]
MALKKSEILLLAKRCDRPPLWEKTDVFWADPYISKHILHAHLNPDTDDASRKPATIRLSADWIAEQAGGGAGRELLDLGCGPGLYCAEFSRLGFDVTGVDFSSNSLRHARASAAENGMLIQYLEKNYLSGELAGTYDVITLIYGDFCVLNDHDRSLLLWKIRGLLKPDGLFAFDVFTHPYVKRTGLKTDWYARIEDGFWHPEPHLVLEQGFAYPEENIHLNQYTIFPAGKGQKTFNIWHHYYSPTTIRELLKKHKLSIVCQQGDLTGKPVENDDEWIGIIAKRLP